MTVREADATDWPQLSALIEESNREMSTKYDVPDYTRAHSEICRTAMGIYGGVFVAEDDDTLVGYIAWVAPPGFPAGVVEGLGTYVIPEYRQTGIAKKLRQKACDFHRSNGATKVFGVVHKDNVAGMAASQADGFEVVGLLVRKIL